MTQYTNGSRLQQCSYRFGFIYEQGRKVVQWALCMNREERLSRRRELYRLRRERETTEEREERLARQMKFLDDSRRVHISCSYYIYTYTFLRAVKSKFLSCLSMSDITLLSKFLFSVEPCHSLLPNANLIIVHPSMFKHLSSYR